MSYSNNRMPNGKTQAEESYLAEKSSFKITSVTRYEYFTLLDLKKTKKAKIMPTIEEENPEEIKVTKIIHAVSKTLQAEQEKPHFHTPD